MNKLYLTADPGSTHNGSVTRALALVDCAADSGFDAVKFQLFPQSLSPTNPALDYGFMQALCDRAYERGIEIFASVWDVKALNVLVSCRERPKSVVKNSVSTTFRAVKRF